MYTIENDRLYSLSHDTTHTKSSIDHHVRAGHPCIFFLLLLLLVVLLKSIQSKLLVVVVDVLRVVINLLPLGLRPSPFLRPHHALVLVLPPVGRHHEMLV